EADDGTGKSRLDWAKEALRHTVDQLNPNDTFSLTVFDSKNEVLLPAASVRNKKALIRVIDGLKTRGSTNLHAGLLDGYTQASQSAAKISGRESRVLLISDAFLNTGTTETTQLLKL